MVVGATLRKLSFITDKIVAWLLVGVAHLDLRLLGKAWVSAVILVLILINLICLRVICLAVHIVRLFKDVTSLVA